MKVDRQAFLWRRIFLENKYDIPESVSSIPELTTAIHRPPVVVSGKKQDPAQPEKPKKQDPAQPEKPKKQDPAQPEKPKKQDPAQPEKPKKQRTAQTNKKEQKKQAPIPAVPVFQAPPAPLVVVQPPASIETEPRKQVQSKHDVSVYWENGRMYWRGLFPDDDEYEECEPVQRRKRTREEYENLFIWEDIDFEDGIYGSCTPEEMAIFQELLHENGYDSPTYSDLLDEEGVLSTQTQANAEWLGVGPA